MFRFKLVAVVACFLFSVGCEQNQSTTDPVASTSVTKKSGHAHPSHGPHHGELIELGQEDYHAELVHEDGAVTLYLLDGAASSPVEIPADTLVLNLRHDGAVKSFALTAMPGEEGGAGSASQFVSEDTELEKWLDAGAEGALAIDIEGRSFTGNVKHDHDHADSHGHDHDHEADHDHGDDHDHDHEGHAHGDDGHGHDHGEGPGHDGDHEHGDAKK